MSFLPGQFVIVQASALVRRFGSEEEHYTRGLQNGIVIQQSHVWHEFVADHDDYGLKVDYMVLFSNDTRVYYVSAKSMMLPDQATSPGRLFYRLSE